MFSLISAPRTWQNLLWQRCTEAVSGKRDTLLITLIFVGILGNRRRIIFISLNGSLLLPSTGEDNKKNRYYLFSFTDVVYKSITEMHFNNESSPAAAAASAIIRRNRKRKPQSIFANGTGSRRGRRSRAVGGNFSPILIWHNDESKILSPGERADATITGSMDDGCARVKRVAYLAGETAV